MVQASYPEFVILPLTDTKSDEVWSKNLDRQIREVADYGDITLYGGRDSFVPHYHGDFTPVELCLPISIQGHSGTDIRAKLTNTIMESAEFRAGVIYAITNLRPQVKATVDIVITYNDSASGFITHFLLGRKPGEDKWRFIGGFSEPDTPSYEYDAAREAKEETGLDVVNVQFIGSTLVPDWRWKGEPDQIKTLIFTARAKTFEGTAGDDITAVRWVPIEEMEESLFIDTHKGIFNIVKSYFNLHFFVTAKRKERKEVEPPINSETLELTTGKEGN
jgi:bifunctional NMN adenylyltransferase/nudix hydrolase